MGAKGGSSPGPWSQYSAQTTFLRVPVIDWAGVKIGSKTEFREAARGSQKQQLWNAKVPTPVVAYVVKQGGQYDSKLMVLTETWQEPLGAISEDSLRAEGFPDMAHFRRYWMQRTHTRFPPLKQVRVYRVRPWTEGDAATLGAAIISRLYRDHL